MHYIIDNYTIRLLQSSLDNLNLGWEKNSFTWDLGMYFLSYILYLPQIQYYYKH